MANPVLVEVTRGALVESRHRGAVAVADADGGKVLALGDVEAPVYPRSAVKALQAMVMVESGAADRFGFGDEELALACASHAGEPEHVAGVARMLARAGLDERALQCGTHPPLSRQAAEALLRAGQSPSSLHHNCSGKHAGFLCAACATSADVGSYARATHPVQREVRAVFEQMSDAAIQEDWIGIDGCSVPTFALPLSAFARAFARFGTGHGLSPVRAAAVKRLRMAVAAKPWFVSGTGMYGTEIMRRFGARVFVKSGAEAAFCAALPEQGLGIAVKCDDGGGRAAEAIMAATIARFMPAGDRAVLEPFFRQTLRNWRGMAVGEVRRAGAIS